MWPYSLSHLTINAIPCQSRLFLAMHDKDPRILFQLRLGALSPDYSETISSLVKLWLNCCHNIIYSYIRIYLCVAWAKGAVNSTNQWLLYTALFLDCTSMFKILCLSSHLRCKKDNWPRNRNNPKNIETTSILLKQYNLITHLKYDLENNHKSLKNLHLRESHGECIVEVVFKDIFHKFIKKLGFTFHWITIQDFWQSKKWFKNNNGFGLLQWFDIEIIEQLTMIACTCVLHKRGMFQTNRFLSWGRSVYHWIDNPFL